MPIEYTPEQREAYGMRPDGVIRGGAFERTSTQAPPPVDDDGLPFMSHRELGEILGRSPHNSKRIAWETGINQHVEFRGQNFASHRVWFSTRDVQKHVESLRNGTHFATRNDDPAQRELLWGQRDKDLKWKLDQAKKAKASKIKNNEPVFDTHNQPHPGNAGFEKRTFRGPRIFTDATGEEMPTHSLAQAINQHKFSSIERR
jgi:hypothetical protein